MFRACLIRHSTPTFATDASSTKFIMPNTTDGVDGGLVGKAVPDQSNRCSFVLEDGWVIVVPGVLTSGGSRCLQECNASAHASDRSHDLLR
jgi:hypothetical protein